jgi:chaperonin GroEL
MPSLPASVDTMIWKSPAMNAASIAALFLTIEAVIADKPDDDDGGIAGMDNF